MLMNAMGIGVRVDVRLSCKNYSIGSEREWEVSFSLPHQRMRDMTTRMEGMDGC
jgi:hypothetical protein